MKTYALHTIVVLAFVILTGMASTRVIDRTKNTYRSQITELTEKNTRLKNALNKFYEFGLKVNVTMYRPTILECDSDPNTLADGTRIQIKNASEYQFVAVSRNLLDRWGGFLKYGDFILLRNAGHKDGVYQVRDTMNAKWVNVVDILESPGTQPYKFLNAHIYRLSLDTYSDNDMDLPILANRTN